MEHIRADFPNAYKPWLPEEETILRDAICDGKSIEEISRQLQRQPGAIESRIRRLGLPARKAQRPVKKAANNRNIVEVDIPSIRFLPEEELSISIRWVWKPVYRDGDAIYQFPLPTTRFMNECYAGPAVYRWKVIDCHSNDLLAAYIGSTRSLCPERLSGYLNPKSSKTNQRLHLAFQGYLQLGCAITLDILDTSSFIDGQSSALRMKRDGARLFMESLIIQYYRSRGQNLLNL